MSIEIKKVSERVDPPQSSQLVLLPMSSFAPGTPAASVGAAYAYPIGHKIHHCLYCRNDLAEGKLHACVSHEKTSCPKCKCIYPLSHNHMCYEPAATPPTARDRDMEVIDADIERRVIRPIEVIETDKGKVYAV